MNNNQKIENYLRRTYFYTEMLSTTTISGLLDDNRKTVTHWIKELNIQIFPDYLDRRKTLVLGRMLEVVEQRKHRRIKKEKKSEIIADPLYLSLYRGWGLSNWMSTKKKKKNDKSKYAGKAKEFLKYNAFYTESVINPRKDRTIFVEYDKGEKSFIGAWQIPSEIRKRYKY